MFFVGAGLKYAAIENKLNININMRDVFNTRKFNVTLEDETFKYVVNRKWQSQVLYVGITWQINAKNDEMMKRKVKTDDNMMNEDVF